MPFASLKNDEPSIRNKEVKRNADLKRIAGIANSQHPHAYDFVEWREWTGNNYIKSLYDVKLKDGTIFTHVYPNAGILRRAEHVWDKTSGIMVRLSEGYLY